MEYICSFFCKDKQKQIDALQKEIKNMKHYTTKLQCEYGCHSNLMYPWEYHYCSDGSWSYPIVKSNTFYEENMKPKFEKKK